LIILGCCFHLVTLDAPPVMSIAPNRGLCKGQVNLAHHILKWQREQHVE